MQKVGVSRAREHAFLVSTCAHWPVSGTATAGTVPALYRPRLYRPCTGPFRPCAGPGRTGPVPAQAVPALVEFPAPLVRDPIWQRPIYIMLASLGPHRRAMPLLFCPDHPVIRTSTEYNLPRSIRLFAPFPPPPGGANPTWTPFRSHLGYNFCGISTGSPNSPIWNLGYNFCGISTSSPNSPIWSLGYNFSGI